MQRTPHLRYPSVQEGLVLKPIEELARRQGVKPVASLDDLAQPDLWESDQEYDDFLADLYASRRSDVA